MTLDADMPAYRMVAVSIAYLFVGHESDKPDDEEKLTRPEIRVIRSATQLLAHIAAGLLLAVFVGAANLGGVAPWLAGLAIASAYYLLCALMLRRRIAIWLIRFYQFRAPAEVRSRCEYTPSCSEYSILAIEKYGLVVGFRLGIDRLRRCSGSPGLTDYP